MAAAATAAATLAIIVAMAGAMVVATADTPAAMAVAAAVDMAVDAAVVVVVTWPLRSRLRCRLRRPRSNLEQHGPFGQTFAAGIGCSPCSNHLTAKTTERSDCVASPIFLFAHWANHERHEKRPDKENEPVRRSFRAFRIFICRYICSTGERVTR
jgi:hypothetical protein